MSKIRLEWITGKRLIERWNLEVRELQILIQNGLPVYNTDYGIEDKGPIYRKIPSQNYDPNDFLPEKSIVEKNNLHDFQMLLESPFPISKTGLTKDQILNNLLFRLEDIENYEKDYGLNIDLVKKAIREGSEFALYDSIINGGNRPFLDKFSNEKHIQQLLDDFWSVKLVIGKNGFEPSTNSDQIRLDAFVKNGDTIVLEIDENEEPLRGTLKCTTDDKLEELIDLEFPPPINLKAEYFFSIIEFEYEKIKLNAKNILKTASSEQDLSLYANKNIQRLKEMAYQAHLLSKRLRIKGRSAWDHPDSYVIDVLKTYIIRLILYYQGLFQPYLKIPIQDEDQLRTGLYGLPPIDVSINDLNRRVMEKFYERLGYEIDILDGNSSTHSIQYFKNLAMNKNWRKISANQAVSVGFVGLCHLKLIMATDDDYLRDSQNLPLNDIYFSIIKEEGPPIFGPQALHPKNFIDRLKMWMEIIGSWTLGNYPYFYSKRPTNSYLELYNYDCALKKLETKPIKDKLLSKQKNKQSFKEIARANQAVHNLTAFIKLSDLRNYLINEIGISLPPLLFPVQQDFEFTEHQIKKLRPNQNARIKCRDIAQGIWMERSKITIADMLNEPEIVVASTKSNGKLYSEKTVRNWIKELCPNRSPGRPKKKG